MVRLEMLLPMRPDCLKLLQRLLMGLSEDVQRDGKRLKLVISRTVEFDPKIRMFTALGL